MIGIALVLILRMAFNDFERSIERLTLFQRIVFSFFFSFLFEDVVGTYGIPVFVSFDMKYLR